MPSLSARTTTASSVGSPRVSPVSWTTASLASADTYASGVRSSVRVPATRRTSPVLAYPSPLIENHWPAVKSRRAVIWFSVSVPVLSVLIWLVAPSVSTSVRLRTMALASANWRAPWASMAWTNVGSPVGIAEIAIEIPSSIRSENGSPRTSPTARMTARALQAIMLILPTRESSSICSGDLVRRTPPSRPAI